MRNANRTYKSSVFESYLSDEQKLLEIYNALEGTDYPPDTPVKLVTLENVLWNDQVNDLAFTLDNQLIVLLEHQSTINPNMPFRFLEYLCREYELLLSEVNKYGTKKMNLLTPRFVVFYNGEKPMAEHETLYLSDLFTMPEQGKKSLELVVDVYNINNGYNEELLNRTKSLGEYSKFVNKVRECLGLNFTLEECLQNAIEWCIENNVMSDYLTKHRKEVVNMIIEGPWDWEKALAVAKAEAREEGMEEGITKGETGKSLFFLKQMMAKNNMTFEQAADYFSIEEAEREQLRALI